MIYLLRHSIDDNSRKGGWSSAPLTLDGIKLAEVTAQKLKTTKIRQLKVQKCCQQLMRN